MKKLITIIALSTLSLFAVSCKKENIQPNNPNPNPIGDTTDTIGDTVVTPPPTPIDSIEKIKFTLTGPLVLSQVNKQVLKNGYWQFATNSNSINLNAKKGDTITLIVTVSWPDQFNMGETVKVQLNHTNNYNSFSFTTPYFLSYTTPSGSGSHQMRNDYIIH